MRVWVDIDNPPQVQYLAPLARGFEDAGSTLVLTARDMGMTYDLLHRREIDFLPVGSRFDKGKAAKALGIARRSQALRAAFHGQARPNLLICASRSAALAARSLNIPSFVFCDYEHVHLEIYRRLGSYLVFPDAIECFEFTKRGFKRANLLPFRGLKEDISFVTLTPHRVSAGLPSVSNGQVRLLFRPPAEESHYYTARSGSMAAAFLESLAADPRVAVIFSPRYEWQEGHLRGLSWQTQPFVLQRPLPFLSLLAGVDLVVSGGGTMLREAAYFGVPAYSLFQGKIGAVDRYLESIGRLRIVQSKRDLGLIELTKTPRKPPLRLNPDLVADLIETLTARVHST